MKLKKLVFGLFGVFLLLSVFSVTNKVCNAYLNNTQLDLSTGSAISSNSKIKNTVVTNVSLSLSNKKIGWGIKRNDNHNQPDLGTNNRKLIEQNEDIAIGNPNGKYIYLTFDNGYEAGYTSKILDVLKENDVKAVFFITGHYLNSAGDIVKRMIDENHIVRKSYC